MSAAQAAPDRVSRGGGGGGGWVVLHTISAGLCCACVVQLVGIEGGLEEEVDHAKHACHTHQGENMNDEAQWTGRTTGWRNGRMAEWQNGRMAEWQRRIPFIGVRTCQGERGQKKRNVRGTSTLSHAPSSSKYKVQSAKYEPLPSPSSLPLAMPHHRGPHLVRHGGQKR